MLDLFTPYSDIQKLILWYPALQDPLRYMHLWLHTSGKETGVSYLALYKTSKQGKFYSPPTLDFHITDTVNEAR